MNTDKITSNFILNDPFCGKESMYGALKMHSKVLFLLYLLGNAFLVGCRVKLGQGLVCVVLGQRNGKKKQFP